jgi:hypothetical protein
MKNQILTDVFKHVNGKQRIFMRRRGTVKNKFLGRKFQIIFTSEKTDSSISTWVSRWIEINKLLG